MDTMTSPGGPFRQPGPSRPPRQAAGPATAAAEPTLLPRWALITIGLALAMVLLAVVAVRWSGVEIREPAGALLEQRALRFADRADGGIDVVDHASGAVLQTLHGEQGFLRGVLRGLVRERRLRDIGAGQPFVLSRHADARLQLADHATGQTIELTSFGPDNAAVFLRWLPSVAKTPALSGDKR